MPTTSQMLERADELERRAKALRIAATEMDEQAHGGKRATATTTLAKAMKLRQAQLRATRPVVHNGAHADETDDTPPTRIGRPPGGTDARTRRLYHGIQTILLGGPQRTDVIHRQLRKYGVVRYRVAYLRKLLGRLPFLTRVGYGTGTLWRLRAEDEAPTPHKAPHKAAHKASKAEVPGYGSREARQARRLASQAMLTHFSPTEVKTATMVRDEGVTEAALKAVGALSRRGYLRKKGDGWVRTAKAYTP